MKHHVDKTASTTTPVRCVGALFIKGFGKPATFAKKYQPPFCHSQFSMPANVQPKMTATTPSVKGDSMNTESHAAANLHMGRPLVFTLKRPVMAPAAKSATFVFDA